MAPICSGVKPSRVRWLASSTLAMPSANPRGPRVAMRRAASAVADFGSIRLYDSRFSAPPAAEPPGAPRIGRPQRRRTMPDFSYLIVGGGMTAAAAAKGIREVDAKGTVGILSAEPHRPYQRPPLSKALWQGKPEDGIWIELPKGVEVQQGRRAVAIDRKAHRVRDDRGDEHGYGKLLLATGGAPKKLPFGTAVVYFPTPDDYRNP